MSRSDTWSSDETLIALHGLTAEANLTPSIPIVFLTAATYYAMTLFSEATHKFLPVSEGDSIPTQQFLRACSEIVPFFGTHSLKFDPCTLQLTSARSRDVSSWSRHIQLE